MRYLIIGDMHCKKITSDIEKNYRTRVLKYIKDIIKNENIDEVIQLGDFFDNRKNIDIQAYYDTLDQYKETFGNIKFLCLVGNHDTYYKSTNDVHSTLLFSQTFANFYAIPDILKKKRFIFCSWINEQNIEEFDKILTEADDDSYIFGHFEINGFAKVKGFDETDGLSQSKFHRFNKVFSGHFHLTQDLKNICYVGSLFQNDMNDVNDIKRVMILDTDKDTIEEIRIPITLFERVTITDEDQMINDIINSFKDKIVQVIFNIPRSIKREKFIQKLIDTEVNSDIRIIDNSAMLEDKIELDASNEDVVEIFSDYVSIAENIDDDRKKQLNEIFIDIYKSVKEIE